MGVDRHKSKGRKLLNCRQTRFQGIKLYVMYSKSIFDTFIYTSALNYLAANEYASYAWLIALED